VTNMNDEELTPFLTSDTPFAAFLRYHTHQVVGMRPDPNDMKRKVYVFIRKPDTLDLQAEYYEGDPQVDPKYFYKTVREMFKILKENQ
jgi:hypothetical protein